MHCESVSTYETKGKVSWKIVNMLTSWKLNEKQTTAFLQWAENMRFLEQEMSKLRLVDPLDSPVVWGVYP